MAEQQGRLEITLSLVKNPRESHITGEILLSGLESQRPRHSRPLPLYQADLNGTLFYSNIRELLAIELIRHLMADETQVKGLNIKVEISFLGTDAQFSHEVVLPRIKTIFDLYGYFRGVPVTYEGFDLKR